VQTRGGSSDTAVLCNECQLFTQYLLRHDPDTYVLDCYVRLQHAALRATSTPGISDEVLLEIGKSGLIGLRIADAYARVFRPGCLLRRKLILTFAILENSAQFHSQFTSGLSSTYLSSVLRIAGSIIGFGIALTASLFTVAPRIVLREWESKRRRA